MDKNAVVACIRDRMRRFYRGDHIEAACLYWAEVAFRELAARGERPVLQAGTLSWPCVAVDDGVSGTHFSYVWDAARVPQYLAQGILPEMHVWVALPDRGPQILDVTTCYLAELLMIVAIHLWPDGNADADVNGADLVEVLVDRLDELHPGHVPSELRVANDVG